MNTANERIVAMFNYTRHHEKCSGNCGYCKQLLRENPGKSLQEIKKIEDEDDSRFTWDNPSETL